MTGWTLAAAELRIPRATSLAAHRMLVIANPAGDAVRQINGLASWFDREAGCWRHKPIGYLRTDRLRGYDTQVHPRTFLPMNGVGLRSRSLAPAIDSGAVRVLAAGMSQADLANLLAPGLVALARINALSDGPQGGAGVPYPFLGFGRNSNSFFSTLLRAIGLPEPAFSRPAVLAPGAGRLLLSDTVLAEIAAAIPSLATTRRVMT